MPPVGAACSLDRSRHQPQRALTALTRSSRVISSRSCTCSSMPSYHDSLKAQGSTGLERQ
eukprot:scaffold17377_cov180-Isochrysis_galbana.AAC.1